MHSSVRRITLAFLLGAAACARQAPPAGSGPSSDAAAAAPGRVDATEIGSLRNARVAIPRAPGDPPLTFLAGPLDEATLQEIARQAPGVRVLAGLTREEALARAGEAHGADGRFATPEFLRAAGNLRWIQTQSAGVDHVLSEPELASRDSIVITNMRAVHGPAIADHVFAMLLALTRDMPVHVAGRERGQWQAQGSGVLTPIALEGRTLLVVGLGGIGTEIARRGAGFGMRVLGIRRSDAPVPAFVERVGRPAELHAYLAEADVVALAVPLTPETDGLIDAAALAAMKRGGYLLNIARGRVVDQDALLGAVKSGHLAGAGLDVTEPEPLPPDHPLWQQPTVLITPHTAGRAELTQERRLAVFVENLRRFGAGEPLLNVVDRAAGY